MFLKGNSFRCELSILQRDTCAMLLRKHRTRRSLISAIGCEAKLTLTNDSLPAASCIEDGVTLMRSWCLISRSPRIFNLRYVSEQVADDPPRNKFRGINFVRRVSCLVSRDINEKSAMLFFLFKWTQMSAAAVRRGFIYYRQVSPSPRKLERRDRIVANIFRNILSLSARTLLCFCILYFLCKCSYIAVAFRKCALFCMHRYRSLSRCRGAMYLLSFALFTPWQSENWFSPR